MPNTLAHIGIQAVVTSRIIREADTKWILIGCIIPDVPWIIRRVAIFVLDPNPYDLRLYAIVQSSLFFCLILALALAALSGRYWRTFAILSVNALLHLLLDALQIKWGNGVHLAAPLSWQLTRFDLFWPESVATLGLTIFGLCYFGLKWRTAIWAPLKPNLRLGVMLPLLAVYLALPPLFFEGPESKDNHFVATLRNVETRGGRPIEIDRARYVINGDSAALVVFNSEEIAVEGLNADPGAKVTVKGVFADNHRIRVLAAHHHSRLSRDIPTYVGLILIALFWIRHLLAHKTAGND